MNLPERATQPTMYFIGVTTTKSSIMKVFPQWTEALGLRGAVLKGVDIAIHANASEYREIVEFIKNDPLSLGALVTTHKLDLYAAAKDLFDFLDPYAVRFGELSSISKKDGRLEGYAKDPITSGLSMKSFIPEGFWREHSGDAFIMGAGGSGLSICAYLADSRHGDDVPDRIILSNRSQPRLEEAKVKLAGLLPDERLSFVLCPTPEENDAILDRLKPHSFVVNATGLGKDRPGSPLTDACRFPDGTLVWEINYRGDLRFLWQAVEQMDERHLFVEDGWTYFLHGWTQVIAEVFQIDITPERFSACEAIARSLR
jgi:shikimate dehydrogenase